MVKHSRFSLFLKSQNLDILLSASEVYVAEPDLRIKALILTLPLAMSSKTLQCEYLSLCHTLQQLLLTSALILSSETF